MVEKKKTDVDRQILSCKIRRSSILANSIRQIIFITTSISRLFTSIFINTDIFLFLMWIGRPLRGCLLKIRATHYLWNMIIPGLIFSCDTKIALQFRWTGTRTVPFFAAPPAIPASIRPLTVRGHMAGSQRSGSTGPPSFSCGPHWLKRDPIDD